jgi:hypothetical protein
MDTFIGGIVALLVFIGLSTPILIVCLVYYFKKRLEHKQIMAAIEKGTPLSELRPVKKHIGPAWIRAYTSGIAMLIIAVGLTLVILLMLNTGAPRQLMILLLIPVVFLGNGLAALIRGRMLKKIPQETPPEQNIAECSQNMEKTPIEA